VKSCPETNPSDASCFVALYIQAMSVLPQEQDPLAPQREFYRQQLAFSFSRSREFTEPLGIVAEQIVDTGEGERALRECSPGSLDCARRLGEMAVVLLNQALVRNTAGGETGAETGPGNLRLTPRLPWWRDLVDFERAWFLQAATTAAAPPANRPRRGVSALCAAFAWDIPQVRERLQSGAPIGDDHDLRRKLTLLFARRRDGEVRVVEAGAVVEKVFRATNGLRTAEQIAAAAALSLAASERILNALADIGAVVPAMSAEDMTRAIEAREQR